MRSTKTATIASGSHLVFRSGFWKSDDRHDHVRHEVSLAATTTMPKTAHPNAHQ
jgi:hypothetical protein